LGYSDEAKVVGGLSPPGRVPNELGYDEYLKSWFSRNTSCFCGHGLRNAGWPDATSADCDASWPHAVAAERNAGWPDATSANGDAGWPNAVAAHNGNASRADAVTAHNGNASRADAASTERDAGRTDAITAKSFLNQNLQIRTFSNTPHQVWGI
jgi:hypothetical protein